MGFDLVIYEDSVEFMMEKCKPSAIFLGKDLYYEDLKPKLALMHSLGIAHCDIKEDNIMLSQERGELVFIDFNCSSIVKEKIGEKSLTKFKGTATFCSSQMFEIFTTNMYGFVDLYYNDVHGLNLQIKQQELKIKERQKLEGESKSNSRDN